MNNTETPQVLPAWFTINYSLFTLHYSLSRRKAAFLLAGVVGIEPTSKVLETPILPLNHTPVWKISLRLRAIAQRRKWCANRDSNPGPTGYEPVALTN